MRRGGRIVALAVALLAAGAAPAAAQEGAGGPPSLGNAQFSSFKDACPTRKEARAIRRKLHPSRRARERFTPGLIRQREVLKATPKMVKLGERLFTSTTAFGQRPTKDPQLSGRKLSCLSCHFGPGFTDSTFHLVPTERRAFTFRSTPHLLDVGGTPLRFDDAADAGGFGWDGRFPCAQAFSKSAILAVTEMNASREPTQRELDALAAYMLKLRAPKAAPHEDFDPVLAAKGKRIFDTPRTTIDPGGEFPLTQKASCATCHEGVDGTDHEFHRSLNVRGDPVLDPGRVDPDGDGTDQGATIPPIEFGGEEGETPGLGEGQVVNVRTPALLGVRFTAPYFHEAFPECGAPVSRQDVPAAAQDAVTRAALLCVTAFYSARFGWAFSPDEQQALIEYMMSL